MYSGINIYVIMSLQFAMYKGFFINVSYSEDAAGMREMCLSNSQYVSKLLSKVLYLIYYTTISNSPSIF